MHWVQVDDACAHSDSFGGLAAGQLQRTADGLTTKVLNDRLSKLVRLGIVDRHAYAEIPPRVEYRLTDFGEQFLRIIDQIDELQRKFGRSVESDLGE